MGTQVMEKSYKQQDRVGAPGVEKPDSFRHCTCGLRIRRGGQRRRTVGEGWRARAEQSGRGRSLDARLTAEGTGDAG